MQHMSSGKATCVDASSAETYKAGGLPYIVIKMHVFKDASIIHLYKRKEILQVCDKLFNQKRLKTKCKEQNDVLDQLLYADDWTENAKTETTVQGAIDRMPQACDNYGLTIIVPRIFSLTSNSKSI